MNNFSEFHKEAAAILAAVKKHSAKQVSSTYLKNRVKRLVFDYFNNLKPQLAIDSNQLDDFMQELIEIVGKKSSVSTYKKILKRIKRLLEQIELANEIEKSKNNSHSFRTPDPLSSIIMKTLESICPTASFSYTQVLEDLRDNDRISYRGTAAEIRESLREVLDLLAPDDDLQKAGIKIEKDKKVYTMNQKVRFILKSRGTSESKRQAPESAADIVDDAIAKLVRSTYARGSITTHTIAAEKREISLLKKYLDLALCELLEIPV
jgi:hypothetical protein